eukprot:TRINITY_DN108851_c0_g1_i1.p2 TRINITY_DN108851_c0_g1~~TRINITY_DN108851_c0_g1_i1.p2  ORF type:complete len:247 (-),score=46.81 TRINITY_DN108851_c0_g1_i1:15-755(-)
MNHTPLDLARNPRPLLPKKEFLGYMAYACVDHRERLFDLLVAAASKRGLPAPDALSRCAGYRSMYRHARRNHTRSMKATFLDEAVDLLLPYRFTLVFENKLVPGYVTEKIVNAFLAGSIPIYWGSRAALEIFNPDALVYANDIQVQGVSDDYSPQDPLLNLELVAEHVMELASDEAALQMMATAPAISEDQLKRYFSWHRSVRNELTGEAAQLLPHRLSEALRGVMAPRKRRVLCKDGLRICEEPY